ncbi:hypothetical protein JG687_00002209 [Phytophthora cactorum]|uniref:Uncharacterized protein n=1 Tax=Phytophthora cactorum TaxID=29920 RepID=A0A329SFC7_9STRA|nr:hypothetical protein PC114_g23143 [Phytophthora cactorum]KAG2949147.1 hypothetical protein PC117_g5456 [Phytophthora cactorum]KAG3025795.1 hypothetical protein PC120_g6274 [Phytophthora cactorum]KAG3033196.1 hypothetical protein PC119_g5373 [Phytophthora cactorum]KAG3130977.1 hypothetical protein C6341_g23526 [Phytophthora cactorum]
MPLGFANGGLVLLAVDLSGERWYVMLAQAVIGGLLGGPAARGADSGLGPSAPIRGLDGRLPGAPGLQLAVSILLCSSTPIPFKRDCARGCLARYGWVADSRKE